jgi:hypothetical protein
VWTNAALREAVIDSFDANESIHFERQSDLYMLLDLYCSTELGRKDGEYFPSFEKKRISTVLEEAKQAIKITPDMRLDQDRNQAAYHAQIAAERRASRQNLAG